jgi:alpha-1,6-mannosyltransferase
MTGARRGLWSIGAAGIAGEALYAALALAPDLRRHLLLFFALFLSCGLLAIGAAVGARPEHRRLILAFALLYRATLLARPAELSNDVYRYLWDGRVTAAGFSPYALAPRDPRLAFLRDDAWTRMSHRDVRSVYPPVAEAIFRSVVIIGRTPAAMKLLAAAADFAVVLLLARLAGAGALAPVVIYAWHPLPIFFSAVEAHIDPIGVALLVSAVLYLRSGYRGLSGGAAGLSFATKLVPGAALIPFLRAGRLRWLGAFTAVGASCVALALSWGAASTGGLADYATRWSFNSASYCGAEALIRTTHLAARSKQAFIRWKQKHPPDPAWARRVFPLFYDAFFARLLLVLILAVSLVGVGVFVRDTERAIFASLAALLLLSPTLYPWYLLWVLPFAAHLRSRAFLYLSTVCCLSMALLYPVSPFSPPIVMAIEFVPFAALLIADLASGRRPAAPEVS